MFIGEKEIKDVQPEKEVFVKVIFTDDTSSVIHSELFGLLQTEEKGNGTVTDKVNDYFARKFIAELSQYDLGFYFANSIGIAMETLCHNLREELTRKTFHCSGSNDISIKLLVDSIADEK